MSRHIREKYAKAFEGFERIQAIADQLVERNQEKVIIDPTRFATLAAVALYAKARKAARAVQLLADTGFGEDGLILGRSMVNLAIDFEYVCGRKTTAEALARQWFARGQMVRHEFASKTGSTWKGADKIEWKREALLANAWKACSIEQRARAANLPSYYDLPYRHGCSFDHSDSWGAASFLDITVEGAVDLLTMPGEAFVDFALLAGGFALAQVVKTLGDFYDFDFAGADRQLEEILAVYASVLLALLCLLTLATSASAECAWVMWGIQAAAVSGGFMAVPLDSGTTREQCEQVRRQWQVNAQAEKSVEEAKSGPGYICLPDTVDPRGPKGK